MPSPAPSFYLFYVRTARKVRSSHGPRPGADCASRRHLATTRPRPRPSFGSRWRRRAASPTTPTVATAGYGCFRLRDARYTSADVTRWAQTMRNEARWGDVFVYFKHEAKAKGPELASEIVTALGRAPRRPRCYAGGC